MNLFTLNSKHTFLISFIVLSGVICSIIIAINIFANPHGFWKHNLIIPMAKKNVDDRIYHPLRLSNGNFDYVFLGSSRVREGFVFSEGFLEDTYYNAGLSGATAFEIAKMAGIIAEQEKLPKHVIIGLDLFGFKHGQYLIPTPSNTLLNGQSSLLVKLKVAFTGRALKSSLLNIRDNFVGKQEKLPHQFTSYKSGNHLLRFKAGLKEHADRFLQDFGDVKTDPRILAELEKNISKLTKHGVKVTVITNPLHASRLYLIEQNQLQPHLLEIVQELNRMTKKINSYDQSQVEFWHFAHCDSNNFEPIPHNPDDHMQYFYDANHFTPTLGMDIAKQSFLRHQYVNYKPFYQGKNLTNVPSSSISLDLGKCSTQLDRYIEDISYSKN